jgi:8-oxo-dGTP diphosphatase
VSFQNQVHLAYGNRLRVRSCGICIEQDTILLVNHRGLRAGDFWAPPGGGIELGETAAQAVVREFREETNLEIAVGNFLFACEYLHEPLHAIELFFEVKRTGGTALTGIDPENPELPVIDAVRWIPLWELGNWRPEEIHGVFRFCSKPAEIISLRGYFTLPGVV